MENWIENANSKLQKSEQKIRKNFWVSEAKKFPDELTFVYNNFSEKKSIFEEDSEYLINVHNGKFRFMWFPKKDKSGLRKSKNS